MADWFGDQREVTPCNNAINGRAQGLYCSTAADGAGNIKYIDVWLYRWCDGGGSCNTRCALYANDKSLIAQTEDVFWPNNSPEVTGWVTHTFATSVPVTASTEYILACCSDAGGTHEAQVMYWATDTFKMVYNAAVASPPTFDDTLGGDDYSGYDRGIYATYEDAVTGPSEGMGLTMGLGFGGPQSAGLTAKVPQVGHRTGQMQRPRSRVH